MNEFLNAMAQEKKLGELRAMIRNIREGYRQDSVAATCAATEFVW